MTRKIKQKLSSISKSKSLNSRDAPAATRFRNRTKLVNRKLRDINCRVFWINTHGVLKIDNSHDVPKCILRPTPFKIMFRFIDAAPGEINVASDDQTEDHILYYNNPDLCDKAKTADSLAFKLEQIGNMNFDRINKSSVIYVNPENKIETNLGRDERYLRLINYQNSPFCLKTLSLLDVEEGYEDTTGVILLEDNKKKKLNLFFSSSFIKFLQREDPSRSNWRLLKSSNIVESVTNELLFKYIYNTFGENVFFIDSSCDWSKELSIDSAQHEVSEILRITGLDYVDTIESKCDEITDEIKLLEEDEIDTEAEEKQLRKLEDELKEFTEQDFRKRLADIFKEKSKTAETLYNIESFLKSKLLQIPGVRRLSLYKENSKRNKKRWHVVNEGDNQKTR